MVDTSYRVLEESIINIEAEKVMNDEQRRRHSDLFDLTVPEDDSNRDGDCSNLS